MEKKLKLKKFRLLKNKEHYYLKSINTDIYKECKSSAKIGLNYS